jgi:hypothetical protein
MYKLDVVPIIQIQLDLAYLSLLRLERTRVLFTFNAGGGAPTILFS